MKKLIFILFAGLFALMCKKEQTIPDPPIVEEKPECEPLQYSSEPSIEWFFTGIAPYYRYIDINPYDPNEILLTYIKEAGQLLQVIRYHLQTKQKEVLLEDFPISSAPRWSHKDWITFSGRSGPQSWDIYKMKSSGDSLTQLTFMGNCHGPEWNWKADRLISKLGLVSPTISLVFDEHGGIRDTVNGGSYTPSWRHDSLYTNTGPSGLFVNDPTKDTTIFFLPFENLNFSFNGGAEWVNGENIIWSNIEGVFKTNINTGQTVQLKESCDSVTYSCPAYSFISGKVTFIQTVKEITGPSSGTAKTSLVIMNADDGSEEEEIDLE